MKLYESLARSLIAMRNCGKSGNSDWLAKHRETTELLTRAHLPSGSGFDCGTTFDFNASHGEYLVFNTSFHHMDENGGYDGWTDHTVTIRPSLAFRFTVTVRGRNRNDIKEYIEEVFMQALDIDVE
jgi:hypothetical protein